MIMWNQKLKTYNIILASGSPRRQQFLKDLNIDFTIKLKPVEETYPKRLKHFEIPDYLAQLKALSFKETLDKNDLLITSDTIVWHNENALGKPKSKTDAQHMLRALSHDTHEVISSVCLTTCDKQMTLNATTSVTFKPLTDEEIDYYIETYQPFDKAGSYGIQEWIGQIGIIKIEGSYCNVVGLPTHLLYKALNNFLNSK